MKIVVLYSNHGDTDCARLTQMWEGLADVQVFELTKQMTDLEQEDLVYEALSTPCDVFLMCGHGTSWGLLAPNFSQYMIHEYCAPYNRTNIVGVFCHAAEFAKTYGLHGFYTSMFISNINEAVDYGVSCTADEIEEQNESFCQAIHQLLEDEVPISEWMDHFHVSDEDSAVEQFNISGLCYC